MVHHRSVSVSSAGVLCVSELTMDDAETVECELKERQLMEKYEMKSF